MNIAELSRRDFLRYSAGLAALLLPNIGNNIYAESVVPAPQLKDKIQKYYIRGKVTEDNVDLLNIGATLEFLVDKYDYYAKLYVFDTKGKNILYLHTSNGAVKDERPISKKLMICSNFLPFSLLHNIIFLDFKYDNEGRLTKVDYHKENRLGNILGIKTKRKTTDIKDKAYNSSTDILTAMVQAFRDLKKGNMPEKVYFIDKSAEPNEAELSLCMDKVTVKFQNPKTSQKIYSGSADVITNKNFDPVIITISLTYAKKPSDAKLIGFNGYCEKIEPTNQPSLIR